jgi:hypothetical protein
MLQQGVQPLDLGEVLLLGLFDGHLGQVVSKHVLWIALVHSLSPLTIEACSIRSRVRYRAVWRELKLECHRIEGCLGLR